MSTTIDQRIVSMKFDNAGFSSGVKETLSDLQGLDRKLEQSASGSALSGLQSSINSITFEKMAQNIDNIASHFTVLGRAWDLTLGQMLYSATKWGLDTAKAMSIDNVGAGFEKFGQKTTSVSTLLAQGFDLDEIDEQLEKLNWFSDETSYSFTDMVDNIAKFTASGRDLEESSTALMGIANWAALSGQNAQTASRAMYQLSQAMGAGVMRKQDYMSVQNANMDTQQFRQMAIEAAIARGTLKELEEGVYKSTVGSKDNAFTIDQFTEELTKGAWFTSDVMMDVFNQYASAVDQIYDYVNNSDVDTTSQAIEEMSALGIEIDDFGKTAFLAAQQARTWTDVIDSVKDAASTGWMKIFGYIFGNTEETIDLFTDMANSLWEVFVGPIAAIAELMKEWYDFGGRTALWEGLGALWSNLTGILNAFGDALGIIFPIFEEGQGIALANATSGFAEFMKSIALSDEELVTLADTMAGLMLPLSWIFDLVSQIWGVLKPSLFGDTGSLLGFIGEKLKELSAYFTGADESVRGFNSFIAGLVDSLLRFLHGGYLDQLTQFVVFMSGAFATAVGVLGKILGFVGAKVVAFKGAVLDKLGNAFGAFMNTLQSAFKIAMNIPAAFVFIGSTIKNLIDGIKEAVKQFFDFEKISGAVGTAFSLLFGGLYLTITGTASLGEMIIGIGKNIVDFFTRIHTAITEGNGITGFIEVLKTKAAEAATALTENFKKFINIEQFAKTIGVAFNILNTRIAAITGIDLAKIFKAIGAIAQKIVKPFTKLKFVLDNLKTTFSDLKESVKKFFDFKGMFSSVGDAIGEFWTTVHDGITNASTFASVTDAVGAAFEALGKTIHDKFLEKFKIGEFFSDLKTELGNFASGMQEGFLGMLGFDETTDETQQTVDQLNAKLEETPNIVEEPVTAFSDLKKIIELAKQELETFWKSIGSNFEAKFGPLAKALKKVAGAFKDLRDKLKGSLPNLKEIIKKHIKLKGVVEDVSKAFEDFGDKFWEAFSGKKSMPQRIEEAKKAFEELVDAIKRAFKENLDFSGLWTDLSDSFNLIYEDITNFFKQDFGEFFKTISDGFNETWEAIKPYEEDNLWDAIVNNVGRVKDGFDKAKENAKGLVEALQETKVYQDAANSINAMVEAVEKTTIFQVISGAIGTVQRGVEDLVKTFKESDTGIKLAEIWSEFTVALSSVDWTTPSTALASISSSLGDMLGSLNSLRVEKLTEFVNSIDKTMEGFAEKFVGVYNIYYYLKNFKDNVALLVRQGVEGFAEGFSSADWDKIIDRAFGVVGFIIIIRLLAMINQIGETAGVIGTIAKNVKKFTGQLNSILMGTKWLFMAEMFKGLALAVIAIAGALFVLAAVPDQDLSKAVAAIVAIVLVFTLFAAVKGAFGKVKDATSEASIVKEKVETLKDAIGTLAEAVKEGLKKASLFFSIAAVVAAIGFVVWAFVTVMDDLQLIDWAQLGTNLLKIGMILLTVVAVIVALSYVNKVLGGVDWGMVGAIVAIGVIVWVIAQAFSAFEGLSPEGYERGFTTLIFIFLGLALVMAAISRLPNKSSIYAMGALLLELVVFAMLMMIPMNMFASMSWPNLGKALTGVAAIMVCVTILALVAMYLTTTLKKGQVSALDYGAMIGSVLAMALAMLIIAGAVALLGNMDDGDFVKAMVALLAMALVIGILFSVVMKAAEKVAVKPDMLIGIAATIIAIVAISASILLLAAAVGVMADICTKVASMSKGDFFITLGTMIFAMVALVAVVALIAHVISATHAEIALLSVAASVFVISASLLVLALAAGALAMVAPSFAEHFKEVAITLIALAAALLLLGAIGTFMSGGLLTIAAVLGATAAIILVIAAAMIIFAKVVPETFGQTLDDLMNRADQIANVIAVIIYAVAVGLVRGIASALPPILEALGQMLAQTWQLLIKGVKWIVEGIAQWVVNDGPSKLLQSILFLVDTILIAMLTALAGILGPLGGWAEGAIDWLEEDAKKHAQKAGFDTGETAMAGVEEGLESSTQAVEEQAVENGFNIGAALGEGYESSSDALTAITENLNFAAAGSMMDGPWTLKGDENLSALMETYSGGIPDLENTGESMNEAIVGTLSEADTASAAEISVDKYAGYIANQGTQQTVSASNTMGQSGATELNRHTDEYYASSRNNVAGAARGIMDNMQLYLNAVASMAMQGNTVFNKLNIVKSPSRLFAESTRWVVLGAAKGIQDNSDVYISSLTDMASRSNKAFAAVAADLNSYDFSNINGTPTITPVLDMSNVRNGMANVSDLFNNNVTTVSAGLNVTSRFDEINAYASQLAAASKQGNDSVMQAIERQTRRTEELIAAVRQGNRIYLDGKTLVGGIIGDIDSGLGTRTQKWARGV